MSRPATRPVLAIEQPVELRLARRGRPGVKEDAKPFVLLAWCTPQGTVGHVLTIAGHGTPHALSTLQSGAIFPGVAVDGWQGEAFDFAAAGLYPIVEVR
jgi:hypothetical protein